MIASFSGIGGSGKTTHIAALAAHLREEGAPVRLIASRDHFWWPRVVALLKGSKPAPAHEDGRGAESAKGRASSAKHVIRALFYLADFWRFYLTTVLPASRRGVLILDRTFPDFVVELALDYGRLDGLLRLVLRLAPKPDVDFWFDLPSEVAIARKFEVPLEELNRHREMYEAVMPLTRAIGIDPSQDMDSVQAILRSLTLLALSSRGRFDALGALLFSDVTLAGLARSSWRRFLNNAARNRGLFGALRRLEAAPGARDEFAEAYGIIDERLELAAGSDRILARYVAESGDDAVAIKRGHDVELGGDLDAVFRDREALARFFTWSSLGGDAESVSEDKADAFFEGALPIDGHVGFTVSGFVYLSSEDIFAHPEEAEALAIIAHGATELTMVTAGDALKLRAHGETDLRVMRAIARSHGWLGLLAYWLAVEPSRIGYAFPYRIPAWRLMAWRVRRWIHQLDGNPLEDAWMLARGIRARLLGKLPYHEPWYRF